MSTRIARAVLIASIALLATIGVAWTQGSPGEPRADLRGDTVTTTTTPTRSASAPVPTTLPPVLTPPGAAGAEPGLPGRLSIPALGIDSPIVPVGLEPNGSMQIPGATEAGWYLNGPRPGAASGSSVVAAHVDYNSRPGVFLELGRLEVGSEVAVTDDAGAVHRFVVTERFQVDKDELPRAELFRTGGPPTLTLITCGGAFSNGSRSYADNIIVRAVPA